ncbi:MAG TPA: Tol-Pal system beta propeller repeat protein TolB [Anaeromyxobacteraceae bacterium]|nr:Tol-Pal system beta propeller repeat protein TolB [Anaeromyxobacteraceae bacterium]
MTRTLLLAAALAAAVPAAAAEDRPLIEVGSPTFHPLPIAVAPFQADADARGVADTVAQVLRADLVLSGLFDVLDPKGFLADATEGLTAPTIKFARWADVGADGLVKARLRRAPGTLKGELHLFEVRAGREVLLQEHGVAPVEARELAHRFADDVIQYYTREPGPFRSKIAAVRKSRDLRELVVFDADGKNPRVLLSDRSLLLLPAWKPDGSEILLTSYRGGRPELWALRVADRSFRKLVSVGEMSMGGVYSPDGGRIAFVASQGNNTDIWVMKADGSEPRRLTTDPAIDVSPSWSPDGRRIAFVSDRAGTPQIYVMNADGSSPRRLTFQGNYNQTPQWSPRGDLIAFTARDERKVFDLFVVSPETGKITRLTQDQGRTNEEPSWAPNGRLLVFTSDRNGAPQLVISDPRGDRQVVVSDGQGLLTTPAWGPVPR